MKKTPHWKEQEMHVTVDYSDDGIRRVIIEATHPVTVRRLRKDKRFVEESDWDRFYVKGLWLGRSIPVSLYPEQRRRVQKRLQKPGDASIPPIKAQSKRLQISSVEP